MLGVVLGHDCFEHFVADRRENLVGVVFVEVEMDLRDELLHRPV